MPASDAGGRRALARLGVIVAIIGASAAVPLGSLSGTAGLGIAIALAIAAGLGSGTSP